MRVLVSIVSIIGLSSFSAAAQECPDTAPSEARFGPVWCDWEPPGGDGHTTILHWVPCSALLNGDPSDLCGFLPSCQFLGANIWQSGDNGWCRIRCKYMCDEPPFGGGFGWN